MESDSIILEDETIEDLQLAGLRLIQKKHGFRYGMDSVLLAHFADIGHGDSVADFGTGNGILPLLLIGRNKGKRFTAIEIQDDAAELAQRNMVLNHLENKVEIIHADVRDAAQFIQPCSMDAVICNPPYSRPYASLASPNAKKATARNQQEDTLIHFFKSSFTILKGKGKLMLVYPAQQMLYVMRELQRFHLEPKKIQMVYPTMEKPAILVMIEAMKDARPTLHQMPPMIIRDANGDLTNKLKSVYHMSD